MRKGRAQYSQLDLLLGAAFTAAEALGHSSRQCHSLQRRQVSGGEGLLGFAEEVAGRG